MDRLAGRGLVTRSPDPADRRGVLVGLTPTGKAAVDAAFEALIESERTLLNELADGDQTELTRLLKALMAPLRP